MSIQFNKLSPEDQKMILAKANHVIANSNLGYDTANDLIEYGERKGLFDKVKFGHKEVYPHPETDLLTDKN